MRTLCRRTTETVGRKLGLAIILPLATLLLSSCFPFGDSPPPSSTPQPCYLFSPFTQVVSVQVNDEAPADQSIEIAQTCVQHTSVKLGTPIISKPDPRDSTVAISIQAFVDAYTVSLAHPDEISVDNCSGTSDVQVAFRLTKTIQPSVLVGVQSYSRSPTQVSGYEDEVVKAIFAAYPTFNDFAPAVFELFPVTAKAHSRVTRSIPWTETLDRGFATMTRGAGNVEYGVTFLVPIRLDIDQQSMTAHPGTTTPCGGT
jgi:hypothetical protein